MGMTWKDAAPAAVVGIFIILLVSVLDHARTLFLPLVSAAVLALMLEPIAIIVRRAGVPATLFASLVVASLLGVLNFGLIHASELLADWVARAPEIWNSVEPKLREALKPFEATFRNMISLREAEVPSAAEIAQISASFLTPTLGELVVFFAALFLLLTSRQELRRYIVFFYNDKEIRQRTLRILTEMEQDLTRYLATVSAINLSLGCVAALIAYSVGLPSPALWAMFAFALEFLPYIGPTILSAGFLATGLLTLDSPSQSFIAPGVYLVVDTLQVYLISPYILGNRLSLSPGAIFLSVIFWAWLWGPVGAFLATPLLIVATVISNHLTGTSASEDSVPSGPAVSTDAAKAGGP
jgi:predicted PurR-regulated permease PerM